MTRASTVMTRGVITARPGTTLERARELMVGNRFSALPVVDGRHRLVGIVSTLDVLRAEVAGRAGARVAEAMTREPMAMSPDSPLTILAHRLRRYGDVRVMPIVEGGFLVGIVTRGDLLRTPERRSMLGRLLGTPDVDLDGPPPDESRVGTTAGEVMTPFEDCWIAEAGMRMDYVAECLTANRLTLLPVLDRDNRLLGVVSEADLLDDPISGRDRRPPRSVEDVMTTGAATVPHDMPLVKVATVMMRHTRRVLPVLGDDDRVVGMISRGDLLRAESPA